MTIHFLFNQEQNNDQRMRGRDNRSDNRGRMAATAVVVEAEIVTDGRARAIMTVRDLVAMGVLRKAPMGRARTSTILLEL